MHPLSPCDQLREFYATLNPQISRTRFGSRGFTWQVSTPHGNSARVSCFEHGIFTSIKVSFSNSNRMVGAVIKGRPEIDSQNGIVTLSSFWGRIQLELPKQATSHPNGG